MKGYLLFLSVATSAQLQQQLLVIPGSITLREKKKKKNQYDFQIFLLDVSQKGKKT